jgi:signal transduction histidine kinase
MMLRTRLTLWYAVVLTASLVLISGGAFNEIYEQLRHSHHPRSERHALDETEELFFAVGLPAVLLGLAGGWWLTRRALAPLSGLIQAAERTDERNLNQALPRTGNGDELDRLAVVLNDMNARLNDSFARIREFTLHASHELKTPLTVMHSELETALRDETLTRPQRELFLSQLDEVQRLSKIVDGLTLLTKADAGQVRLSREPLQLDELVRDAHADAVILAEPQGLQVELAACDPLRVNGDRHRLRQMLLNLADNAVKYNQPGGSVRMALRQKSGSAQFVIENTGPGIPPNGVNRVFERFYRGDAAHGNIVEGCGLGLSIVHWIVGAHGGSIQVHSEPPARTAVTVMLPIQGQSLAA